MRFTISFYDNQGQQIESCTFRISRDESLFDKVEETLYIMRELTPVKPLTWWRELFNNNFMTHFTYHNIQKVKVSYDFRKNHFICEDIDRRKHMGRPLRPARNFESERGSGDISPLLPKTWRVQI